MDHNGDVSQDNISGIQHETSFSQMDQEDDDDDDVGVGAEAEIDETQQTPPRRSKGKERALSEAPEERGEERMSDPLEDDRHDHYDDDEEEEEHPEPEPRGKKAKLASAASQGRPRGKSKKENRGKAYYA